MSSSQNDMQRSFLLTDYVLHSLQDLSLHACCNYFANIQIKLKNVHFVHNYLQFACPFIPKIANSLHYYWSSSITLLFLPYIIDSGFLHITGHNAAEILSWIDSLPSEEKDKKLSNIKKLKVVGLNLNRDYFQSIMTKFVYVQYLTLDTNLTDDILANIGLYYLYLEVLDVQDTINHITDIGLGFLSHCKTLRIILFSTVADEYDYEDKCKFTAKGIALLMLTLSSLERIDCPEYLLRDALFYISNMKCKSNILSLKYLYLAFPDVTTNTITILPTLCFSLHTLSIYIPDKRGHIVGAPLRNLHHLKKLMLKFEAACNVKSLNLIDSDIEYLMIDAQFVSEEEIHHISSIFRCLHTLILSLHSYTFIPYQFDSNSLISSDLFPSLRVLQFEQWISTKLFKRMSQCCMNLTLLYCRKALINGIEDAVDSIISGGGWNHLQYLVLPENDKLASKNFVLKISKLINLKILSMNLESKEDEKSLKFFMNKIGCHFILDCEKYSVPNPSEEFMYFQ